MEDQRLFWEGKGGCRGPGGKCEAVCLAAFSIIFFDYIFVLVFGIKALDFSSSVLDIGWR